MQNDEERVGVVPIGQIQSLQNSTLSCFLASKKRHRNFCWQRMELPRWHPDVFSRWLLPSGSRFYEEAGQKGGPWIMGPVMANAVRRLLGQAILEGLSEFGGIWCSKIWMLKAF